MEVSSKTLSEIDETKTKENLMTLEAVFFVSGRFLSMPDLISLTDLNPIIIRELIEKLQEKYSKNESAIEIVEKNGLWKMDVRPEYACLINKLATGSAEFSKAEQETLAIIAYKQPLKKSDLVKYRGSQCYEHVKVLVEAGLLDAEPCGKTKILKTTSKFSEIYGLESSTPTEIRKFMESILK